MYNVNANVIFYMIFDFIPQEFLHRYFSRILPSQWLFPKISNILLRFVKAMCRKFLSFYDGDNTFQRHSTSWYSAINSSVFSTLFNIAKFCSTKSKLFCFYISWNLIKILFWKFAACSFPNSDWLKTPVLFISRKNHIWLIREVEHCPTFKKSHMINHNAQKSANFLKYIIWFVIYD